MGGIFGKSALETTLTESCVGPLLPQKNVKSFLKLCVKEKNSSIVDPINKLLFIVLSGELRVSVTSDQSTSTDIRTIRGKTTHSCMYDIIV
jgi:hypothetical protein